MDMDLGIALRIGAGDFEQGDDMRRRRVSGRKSKKQFARTASKTNKRNHSGNVMRGGIRL